MMPSFPRLSLSFRTAGFPRYGWKAGISGGAFPRINQLKRAPGVHWLMFGFHPPSGLSPAGMAASLAAPDPDVQISRFRFFMGEPRSWWCTDGQFEALAEGSA